MLITISGGLIVRERLVSDDGQFVATCTEANLRARRLSGSAALPPVAAIVQGSRWPRVEFTAQAWISRQFANRQGVEPSRERAPTAAAEH